MPHVLLFISAADKCDFHIQFFSDRITSIIDEYHKSGTCTKLLYIRHVLFIAYCQLSCYAIFASLKINLVTYFIVFTVFERGDRNENLRRSDVPRGEAYRIVLDSIS